MLLNTIFAFFAVCGLFGLLFASFAIRNARQRHNEDYVPWTDALIGSAAFVPIADGALDTVSESQSGLIARPANQAARDAAAGWR